MNRIKNRRIGELWVLFGILLLSDIALGFANYYQHSWCVEYRREVIGGVVAILWVSYLGAVFFSFRKLESQGNDQPVLVLLFLVISVLVIVNHAWLYTMLYFEVDNYQKTSQSEAIDNHITTLGYPFAQKVEEGAPWHVKYFGDFNHIYYSVTTFTTLGYGDIKPVGRISKMVSISEALFGVVHMVTFFGLFMSRIPERNIGCLESK